ncbi:5'-AMP-activated protein kinase subunit beta-2 isoform X1 [Patella vulgata]|uniref:5'-AMP-activated protein kinase subunit beta-2 isoform X1 n=1 Tax=Patella vulgata TaxID=6465 RepID=UPI0021802FD8|nr:5'-AMP-activated protein kinase subunit beta-2 isoform X1 [Patella vulgata]
MGNSSSAKNRHTSGDETAPTLVAGRHDSTSMPVDDGNMYDPCVYKRARASTITPGAKTAQTTYSHGPRLLPTVFKWEGGGKDVYICGSFNNWKSKIPLVKSQGDFYTIVDLPEGEHEYKFYIDGNWVKDPSEPTKSNQLGTENNIVRVRNTDFEVFEALAIDSRNTHSSKKQESNEGGSPPGDYSQIIPVKQTGGKHTGPPFLPPQLLQIILNKDTPAHVEPSLLPEPNHVMLNHLYALSIKDGVMVLSATHRFRKKYVTTLLYKPI